MGQKPQATCFARLHAKDCLGPWSPQADVLPPGFLAPLVKDQACDPGLGPGPPLQPDVLQRTSKPISSVHACWRENALFILNSACLLLVDRGRPICSTRHFSSTLSLPPQLLNCVFSMLEAGNLCTTGGLGHDGVTSLSFSSTTSVFLIDSGFPANIHRSGSDHTSLETKYGCLF